MDAHKNVYGTRAALGIPLIIKHVFKILSFNDVIEIYMQVLDMCMTLGLVPDRFKSLKGLELYFAMARGYEGAPALDMSKYLNTNYHYLVRPCSVLQQILLSRA